MEAMPVITIAITICTTGTDLERSIQSILGQTLKDIEILCVTSHPAALHDAVVAKYAPCGASLKLVSVHEVKSSLQVAKAILPSASGTYVLFMREGDVFQHKNSCRLLVQMLSRTNVDILHFAMDGIAHQTAAASPYGWETNQNPRFMKLVKEDILMECFERKRFGWSLHNKAFTAALLHKALHSAGDLNGMAGDEAAVFFMLASAADAYIATNAQYIACNGNACAVWDGSASSKSECSAETVQMLKAYLIRNGALDKYKTPFESFHTWLLQMELQRWYHQSNRQEGDRIFQKIWETFGAATVLSELARTYWRQPDQVADKLKGLPVWKPQQKKIETIGTFYYRIGNGGLERVLTTLITLWTAAGYHVVLFLDDRSDGEEYELPEGVERVVLPDTFKINGGTILTRVQAWQNALRDYKIDIVIGHAWISPILLWDILSVKAMHIPYIQYTHGAFSCLLMESDNQTNHYFTQLTHVYGLCDCVVTLSRVNQAFWQCFCDRVYMIFNPSHLDMEKIPPAKLKTPDIVWVGRISPEKRPMDAIHIMRVVADAVPEAKLHIVGKAEDHLAHLEEELRTEILRMHLNENVVLEGFHQSTDAYYQNGSIYLSTSAYEGFPMALMESKIFGLPCVMYELAYLEVSREPAGLLAVPQGDIQKAAESIIRLLRQDEERKQLGREARESAGKYSNAAVTQAWASLLREMESLPGTTREKGDIDIMLQTIMEHLRLGSEKRLRQEADLNRISSFVLMRKVRSVLRCFRTQGWRGVREMVAKKLHALMNKQA